jgi:hypothetical protein
MHLALDEDAFLGHSSLPWVPIQNPALISLDFRLVVLVDITRKGKILTCTQKIYKSKA